MVVVERGERDEAQRARAQNVCGDAGEGVGFEQGRVDEAAVHGEFLRDHVDGEGRHGGQHARETHLGEHAVADPGWGAVGVVHDGKGEGHVFRRDGSREGRFSHVRGDRLGGCLGVLLGEFGRRGALLRHGLVGVQVQDLGDGVRAVQQALQVDVELEDAGADEDGGVLEEALGELGEVGWCGEGVQAEGLRGGLRRLGGFLLAQAGEDGASGALADGGLGGRWLPRAQRDGGLCNLVDSF